MKIFPILFCILALNSLQCGQKSDQNKEREKRARDFKIEQQARADEDKRVFRYRNAKYNPDRRNGKIQW